MKNMQRKKCDFFKKSPQHKIKFVVYFTFFCMQYALYVLNYKKINKNSEKYTKYGKKIYIEK